MPDEAQIREKLAKIQALFAGATTPGEHQAAQAAIDRLQQRIEGLPEVADPPIEFRLTIDNPWSMRLFLALCRSRGLKPYRYPRMRRTSVCLRIAKRAMDTELWPEFQQMSAVLTTYLNELADHIIADCINDDRSEAEVVKSLPGA